jgi:hypothetical protein
MFLKKLSRKKSGKDHCYWALVESVRTARGPRHRVVAYLGELGAEERDGWGRAAATLGRKATTLALLRKVYRPHLCGGQFPSPWDLSLYGQRHGGVCWAHRHGG